MTYPFPFSKTPLPLPHHFYVSSTSSFNYAPQLAIPPQFSLSLNAPFQYHQSNPSYFYNQFCSQASLIKTSYAQQLQNLQLLKQPFMGNHLMKLEPKIETTYVKSEATSVTDQEISQKYEEPLMIIKEEFQTSENLKEDIRTMLDLFIKEFGKTETNELIKSRRNQYVKNPKLLRLFDCLYDKYSSAGKCREDIIRFVLRKAITYMRDTQREKRNVSAKSATILLCKRYFGSRLEELTQNNININDEKELVKFLMPYKKDSRNKTPNNCFMREIFSSKAFYEDYLNYLNNLENLLESDNQKKIERILDFLVTCVEEGKIFKIKDYKRMPWIDRWLETTKKIAGELLEANTTADEGEKPKVYRGKKRKNF